MPKYKVKVTFTNEKLLDINAPDEDRALQKAESIVGAWNGVVEVNEAEIIES